MTQQAPGRPRLEAPTGLAVAAMVLAVGLTLLDVLSTIASVPAARDFGRRCGPGRAPRAPSAGTTA